VVQGLLRDRLTLRKLVSLIDSAYDVLAVLDDNLDGGTEASELDGFITVSSAFYAQLGAVYEQRLAAHLEQHADDEDDDADDEDDEDDEDDPEPWAKA
jgi:hypothetical protein